MTSKEKLFADEFVFLRFNGDETDKWTIAIRAAKTAGYDVPSDRNQAMAFVKALYERSDILTYIENAVDTFTSKLAPSQRRTLWTAISAMELGEITDWIECGHIKIR